MGVDVDDRAHRVMLTHGARQALDFAGIVVGTVMAVVLNLALPHKD